MDGSEEVERVGRREVEREEGEQNVWRGVFNAIPTRFAM